MFDNIHLKHLKFKHTTLALLKQQNAKQVISVYYTRMEFRLLSGKITYLYVTLYCRPIEEVNPLVTAVTLYNPSSMSL